MAPTPPGNDIFSYRASYFQISFRDSHSALRQDDALRARGGESIIGVSLSFADGFSTRPADDHANLKSPDLRRRGRNAAVDGPCAINQADNEGNRCSSVRQP